MKPIPRLLAGAFAAIVGLALLFLVGVYLIVWSSLPSYDGYKTSEHIRETLTIQRDKLGVPFIRAGTRGTVSYGIGFSHGQDRFFQMDMLRRIAAGELSALIGKDMLDHDKEARVHGFRARAKTILEQLTEAEKTTLGQYADGVNDGLTSLATRPPEYWLLQAQPDPWQPEDSLLVVFTFYLDLQSNPELDYARWVARQTLPGEVVRFLDTNTHAWEAAIDGSTFLSRDIPGPQAFSYLKPMPSDTAANFIPDNIETMRGSNNWVAGSEATASGFPLLAGDPHLNLGVPNNWYKISYAYEADTPGRSHEVHGFSIPGIPGIVIGTNGDLAWSATNGSVDTDDLIILEPAEGGYPEFKTPTGTSRILQRKEVIHIKGGKKPVTIEIPHTQWGPVTGETPAGGKIVRRWVAYHVQAANIGAMLTEKSTTTEEFLAAAYETNMPAQNYVVADKEGNTAWTLVGFVPERNGLNPNETLYSSQADQLWTEKLPKEKWPVIRNPENQLLWTANNRASGDKHYLSLGNGGFCEFPRAYQIREGLKAEETHTPRTMASIQHDNSVVFLLRWRTLFLNAIEDAKNPVPEYERMKREIIDWNGKADADSIGYSLIRSFRSRISADVLQHLTLPCIEFDPEKFDPFRFMTEEAVYSIVSKRPPYLLNTAYGSWQQHLEFIASGIAKSIRKRGWDEFRWGHRNRSDYSHPMARALPALKLLLNMPSIELDGDLYCPKVLSHSLAGGVRMIVSPGKLEDSLFQMGCGQSGHPFSPHYRDLHAYWTTKHYLPMLPGDPVHTLTIHPW